MTPAMFNSFVLARLMRDDQFSWSSINTPKNLLTYTLVSHLLFTHICYVNMCVNNKWITRVCVSTDSILCNVTPTCYIVLFCRSVILSVVPSDLW